MTVYEILSSRDHGHGRYRVVGPAGKGGELWRFDGTPRLKDWLARPQQVEFLAARRPLADFLGCSYPGAFAVTHPINPLVASILEDVGELLPVTTQDGTALSLFSATPAFACIDMDATKGERFSDGRLMIVEQFAFRTEALPRRSIFMPSEYPGQLFALQRDDIAPDRDFRFTVEKLGLKGMEFREVWNSDGGPARERPLFDFGSPSR